MIVFCFGIGVMLAVGVVDSWNHFLEHLRVVSKAATTKMEATSETISTKMKEPASEATTMKMKKPQAVSKAATTKMKEPVSKAATKMEEPVSEAATIKGPSRVTTVDLKKHKQGLRVAEWNHQNREKLEALKSKSKLTSSQY